MFGTDFDGDIARMGDVPTPEGQRALSEEDRILVMHVALPTLCGHVLMGTDAPESMGFTVSFGKSQYVNLEPDSREEADAQLHQPRLTNGVID